MERTAKDRGQQMTAEEFYHQDYEGDFDCVLCERLPDKGRAAWEFAEDYAARVADAREKELREALRQGYEIVRCTELALHHKSDCGCSAREWMDEAEKLLAGEPEK
jgi:hypothetical protein